MPVNVLVVQDEAQTASLIKRGLEAEGFAVRIADDGADGLRLVRSYEFDLVILDLLLPSVSGEEVLARMRQGSANVPIIVLTAKDAVSDRVANLDAGADDYITKPFSMRELIARVRAVIRRTGTVPEILERPTALAGGPVEMDTERHEVRVHGSVVEMPPKEFALLESLLRRSGKLMTRESLISQVWGEDYYGDTRTLDVHIKRLRGKIEEDPRSPKHLITVRGLGYRFEP